MQRFDIVLVLGHFRAATAYLSIIRHLSPRLRLALLPAKVDEAFLRLTQRAQKLFIDLGARFGAQIIDEGMPVQTDLMIVQQYPYPPATAAAICASVAARRRLGLMGLATAGLEKHDSFLSLFRIGKVYVPSARLMQFLLAERRAAHRYEGIEVVEIGLPFNRYPVFPEFESDYVIAAPTAFSFHTERGKHQFLRTILELLEQIPASARIAYKTHNGNAKDYFAPKLHYAAARVLRPLGGLHRTLDALAGTTSRRVSRHAEIIKTGLMHRMLLDRAIPMTAMTPYADISLEAFLPGVRHGVIGGLSNAIWGTLYSRLPYYNCIDPTMRDRSSELLPHKSSDALLDLNLRYFGVPYCGGDLRRGARGEEIVLEQDRRGDVMSAIQKDMEEQLLRWM